MRRFTDTEKWTKNKWFRKLRNDLKLLWLFIVDNCDMVGVWEEDIEFVCEILGIKVTKEEALIEFKNQILEMPGGKKWWIKAFCQFQYGVLKEENIKNKPHQRYVQELKKHRLWIDYTKTIHSLEEKEKEKEISKDNSIVEDDEIFSKEQIEQWKAFQQWVKENAPRVLQMKEPLSMEQYFKLVDRYGKIGGLIKAMHNYKPLLQKNVSAYLTIIHWMDKNNKAA